MNEASISTQSDGFIIPSRDGVYARVRNAILRYGASAAIGTAIGVAGVVVDQRFIHNNSSEIPLHPKNVTSKHLDVDGIINAL